MRTLLHLNPTALTEAVRFWVVFAVACVAHVRLGRCSVCHAALRIDDRLGVANGWIAHGECARFARGFAIRTRSAAGLPAGRRRATRCHRRAPARPAERAR